MPQRIDSGIHLILVNFEIVLVLSHVDPGGTSELPETSIRIPEDSFRKIKTVKRGQDFLGYSK